MENVPHFSAVQRMRLSLLWLSSHGATVLRMQAKEGRVLIEIDRAVDIGEPPRRLVFGGEDYRQIELYGCQVLWRQPTTEGDLPDGNSNNT